MTTWKKITLTGWREWYQGQVARMFLPHASGYPLNTNTVIIPTSRIRYAASIPLQTGTRHLRLQKAVRYATRDPISTQKFISVLPGLRMDLFRIRMAFTMM